VAVRRAGDRLAISNLESTKYPDTFLSIDPAQEVDVGKHAWGNYFLGAYKGVFEHLAEAGGQPPAPVGLEVLVHGRVPTGELLHNALHGMRAMHLWGFERVENRQGCSCQSFSSFPTFWGGHKTVLYSQRYVACGM
jgi:hypothetical protein